MKELEDAVVWALSWPLPRVTFADGLQAALAAAGPAGPPPARGHRKQVFGALGAAGLAGAVVLTLRRRGRAA